MRLIKGRLLRRKKRVNSRSNEMVVLQRCVPNADNPGNVEWQDLSPCHALLFHVTPVPMSSRFRYVFHESLPSLQSHLSKERPRAFFDFFRREFFFAGRQVPLVAEWVRELPTAIAPEHIRHRLVRFRTG